MEDAVMKGDVGRTGRLEGRRKLGRPRRRGKHSRLGGFVIALAALIPLSATAQKGGPLPGASPCVALTVSSSPGVVDVLQGIAVQKFSATRIQDLYFTLILAKTAKPISQFELRLYTPKGSLYQSIVVPVANAIDAPANETSRRLSDFPHPVRVQGLSLVTFRDDKYPGVPAPPFLVAGTSIVEHSLYGAWRAEAWLPDGSAGARGGAPQKIGACAAQPFALTQ